MIEKGNLSSFNLERLREIHKCTDNQIMSVVSNARDFFPLVYMLLTETTRFYTTNFSELHKKIKREKRLLVFETPSRVQMTHEYTIEDSANLENDFYFLFNATERLSWLKIFIEEKRVSIASKEIVVFKLIEKLGNELDNLAFIIGEDKTVVANRLYNLSDGRPCFVEFNKVEHIGQQSLLLSLTFFDSIQNKKRNGLKRWWSPLQEKLLTYNYTTLSENATAWIYFKAPSDFNLKVKNKAEEQFVEYSKSNDDEITSIVLKPKDQSLSVNFDISVDVPDALSWWYNGMLYAAIITAIFCIGSVAFHVDDAITNVLNNISLAVIAALIATRGWLMSEEQVMKKMSIAYTILVGLLLFVTLVMSISSNNIKNVRNHDSTEISLEKDSVVIMPVNATSYQENDRSRIIVKLSGK